jgi:hypothetical protein
MEAGSDPGSRTHSPELALVDPAWAEAARRALLLPNDTLASQPSSEIARCEARDVARAIQRLAELSDVEPEKTRRSTRGTSLVFAACAWVTLAVVVVDTFPQGM